MSRGLIGTKLGMTALFTPDGKYVPVTVIQLGPCVVTQIKTKTTDGYDALQLGLGSKKKSRINRPMAGHFKKSGDQVFQFVREVGVENPDEYKVGQTITLDMFDVGDVVNVTGVTKGRGFAGVIKRHGFHGGKATHGSHSHRIPGSIGCSASPAKVIKGKKMPGHYGNATKTIQNLEIVDIRPEENLMMIKGMVPGAKTALVKVQKKKI
jgi:large subunit ribosomal protein L3